MPKTAIEKYYDALNESYAHLLETANLSPRGKAFSQRLTDELLQGQREAAALSQKLAAAGADPSEGYSAILESLLAAQGRALTLAQELASEALGATSDSNQALQKMIAANQKTAAAAGEALQEWMAANPVAKSWMDAFGRMIPVQPADAAPSS